MHNLAYMLHFEIYFILKYTSILFQLLQFTFNIFPLYLKKDLSLKEIVCLKIHLVR